MNTTFLESLAAHTLVTSIGWTLVHFIWQAVLIGAVVGLALGTMQQSSAKVRYLVGLVGLAIMTAAPIGTFSYLVLVSGSGDWKIRTHLDPVQPPAMETRVAVPQTNGEIDFSNGQIIIPGGLFSDLAEAHMSDVEIDKPETRSAFAARFFRKIQRCLPWCVVIWIAGVMCLAVRLLVGLRRVWRWRREGVEIIGGELAAAVARLSARMNLRQHVRLLETARDAVPAVIGWTRPAILVPASMVSGLTTSELESILAHELAHIRRYDYLINLLQTVVETLLFYHPAVWWLSNRIRTERENCCDDIAIAVCGNRIVFAQALARMEAIRCRSENLSMAADGGSLIGRIRRIVGTEQVGAEPWWPAGGIVLGSLGLLLAGLWMTVAAAEPAIVPADVDPVPLVIPTSLLADTNDDEYEISKSEITKTDSKTGIEKRVFSDVKLKAGNADEQKQATAEMVYSNLMRYTFIPARTAKQLGAIELGEIDFGAEAPRPNRPVQMMLLPELLDPAVIATESTEEAEQKRTIEAHELMGPIDDGVTVVPYSDDAIWIPDHLGLYHMNQAKQHVFKIVRIERVDLGVGPAFGPVNALVLEDANSDFGVIGSNWAQQVGGRNGKGLWFDSTGTFHYMAKPDHLNANEPQPAKEVEKQDHAIGKLTVESLSHDESKELNFQIVDRDTDRITRVSIGAFGLGRSAAELVRHFAVLDHDLSKFRGGFSTTNKETIVSAINFNYLFYDRMDASDVLFNLPEGSGLRAEFSGENVEITSGKESTTVVITNGRIEMIDSGGVIRAWASPDGGAEQLVIDCREVLSEVIMSVKTRPVKSDADFPGPPVQVVMNLETRAPADEKDAPHRGIRYEIQQGEVDGQTFMRMKMKWRYDLNRLAGEAGAESGLTLEQLVFGEVDISQSSLQPDFHLDEGDGWGELAQDSGLRSRLLLQTDKPAVGQPMLFKLEVKNFGDKPTSIDPQLYVPFRVLRAKQANGQSAQFIGMTPQTSADKIELKPGESFTCWENVDAASLFLLNDGQYKFLAEGGKGADQVFSRDSNILDVEIAAGKQTPFNRLVGELGKNLPDKWKVSNGTGLAEGWQAVFLTHLPTNLKRDATGIQIWFTEEKLADDFVLGKGEQRQIVTQLGKCELGFMNVAARRPTLDIWPNYLEHIRRATNAAFSIHTEHEQ